MTRSTLFVDDRWRDNNRALRARHGLSASDRRELLRTAVAAVIGLILIAIALDVAGMALTPGSPVATDEAGAALGQDDSSSQL